ncbi:hypothetical protein BOQ02_07495 [Campylobacter coli]|nr:hypothetical protein [Campylobacter coli]OOY01258.1 hypothetical protein BOQ02_07495 [Campylobacter coli]HEB9430815.1 hypothetical protein [Campylobacter coli]HEH4741160.1 hypothetical protein [Campylobacter coli]HEH5496129.1 hypothetical protein [Campylobacter coli]
MFRVDQKGLVNLNLKHKNEIQATQSNQKQTFSFELDLGAKEKSSLYDRPLKELFQEAKEASENALKEYREEIHYNKKTQRYESSFVESNEKYKEKIKEKIEEQIKENIQNNIQSKISHTNIHLNPKQLIAQAQFEEKQKAALKSSDLFI